MKNKIAHRGIFNNIDIPENSMKAFRQAISQSCDFELDVQLTKDNVLIVFHDQNLKRMTGLDQNVEDTLYSEIKMLSLLDTKEKIPTFQEVMSFVQDRVFIDIEIKTTKRIKETCQILFNELSGYHNFSLKSFNPMIVRYLKKQRSDLEVGYLIHSHYSNIFEQLFLPSLGMIHYSKADFLSIHKKLYFKRKYQRLKKHYPISIWTIQEDDTLNDTDYTFICNILPKQKK